MTGELELRRATSGDLEPIEAIHGHPWWVKARFEDPETGPSAFTIVSDGDRVVSTLCLLAVTFKVEGVALPFGQPEFVGTDPEYRNRGLVRRQIDEVHRWSAARGDVAQLIGGIPYFYRQFGYAYALDARAWRYLRPGVVPPPDSGWSVRPATGDDLPQVIAINERAQEQADFVYARSHAEWELIVQSAQPLGLCVAVHDGEIRGVADIQVRDNESSGTTVSGIAVDERPALWALLGEAIRRRPFGTVDVRPALVSALEPVTTGGYRGHGYYVRVPDAVALLERLRPALEARLSRSPLAGSSTALVISTYVEEITIDIDNGSIADINRKRTGMNPEDSVVAVPPDHIGELMFGRYGAIALADRYDDVSLGHHAELMQILFPKLSVDFL